MKDMNDLLQELCEISLAMIFQRDRKNYPLAVTLEKLQFKKLEEISILKRKI
jgi:hypothetical protein